MSIFKVSKRLFVCAQRNVLLLRRHSVMARATMIKTVMTATPTRDQVAVWYSNWGRGVGIGVVVTERKKTETIGEGDDQYRTAHNMGLHSCIVMIGGELR